MYSEYSAQIIYIFAFSRHFYPKQHANEDNRGNQNQQKSNNMLLPCQVPVCKFFVIAIEGQVIIIFIIIKKT